MEKRSLPSNGLRLLTSLLTLFGLTCVSSYQVVVPEKVNAVLGKDITLSCRIEVGSNLCLIQSSWERFLPTGNINLAVFSLEFGISISRDYVKRVSFVSTSVQDATITISGATFADIGPYICKVATFPLGNSEASTYVNVLDPPTTTAAPNTTASLLHDAPPTTAAPNITASLLHDTSGTSTAVYHQLALFTSLTLAPLPDNSLGAIVGRAVGGILFMILLLILGRACYTLQSCTFRGDCNTKQYLSCSDTQKDSQGDVLLSYELQEVYGDKTSQGSQDLKPKLGRDIIYLDTPERKDQDGPTGAGGGQPQGSQGGKLLLLPMLRGHVP